MEGLLHYSTNLWVIFAVIGMVLLTDLIDYLFDNKGKK